MKKENTPKQTHKRLWLSLISVMIIAAAVIGPIEIAKNYNSIVRWVAQEATYRQYTVAELLEDLFDHPVKTTILHEDEYVEVEGYVRRISDDGKYVSLGTSYDDEKYSLYSSVSCLMNTDELKQAALNLKVEDKVIARCRLAIRGDPNLMNEELHYKIEVEDIDKIE